MSEMVSSTHPYYSVSSQRPSTPWLHFTSLFFFLKLNNKHKVHDEVHLWRAQAAFSHDLFSTHYSKTSAGAFLMHIVSFLPPRARYLFPLQAKRSCKISEQDLCPLPRSPSSHLPSVWLASDVIKQLCVYSSQLRRCLVIQVNLKHLELESQGVENGHVSALTMWIGNHLAFH